MLSITKNTTKGLIFYLQPSLSTPVYLISFLNETTHEFKNVICDNAVSEDRDFLELTFTDSLGEDPTRGVLDLAPYGRWIARVYEQTSTLNLDEELATFLGDDVIDVLDPCIYPTVAAEDCIVDNTPPIAADADAQTFFVAAALVGTLTQTEKDAYDAWVTQEKALGTYDDYLAIYPYMGGTSAVMAINAKNPGVFDQTFFNTVPSDFTSTGWQSTGTSYADTNLINSVSMNPFDMSFTRYQRTASAGNGMMMGASDALGARFNMVQRSGALVFFYCYSAFGFTLLTTEANTQGFFVETCRAANDREVYRNGTSYGTNTLNDTAGVQTPNSYYIGAENTGTGAANFTLDEFAFATIKNGSTAVEVTGMNSNMVTFQTALSRNV